MITNTDERWGHVEGHASNDMAVPLIVQQARSRHLMRVDMLG